MISSYRHGHRHMPRKSASSSKAAARSAAIRPAPTRRWPPRNICPTGSLAFRSARSMRRSLQAIHRKRVSRLRRILGGHHSSDRAWPAGFGGTWGHGSERRRNHRLMFGQPGFFRATKAREWFCRTVTSYYTPRRSKRRSNDLSISIGSTRQGYSLSVGAVNVRTGRFAYFDSEITIRAEHIMAGLAAAGISAGRDRWRILLGRRARFQHTVAICAGLFAAPQPSHIPGGRVPCRRPLPQISKKSPSGKRIFVIPVAPHLDRRLPVSARNPPRYQ